MTTRTINPPMASIPSREMRLLVDGLQTWARAISSQTTTAPTVGILEGSWHGTGSLLAALESVSTDLGIGFLSTAFIPVGSVSAEPFADLVEPIVEAVLDGDGVESSYRESFLQRLGADLRIVFPELPWPDEVRTATGTSTDEGRWRRVDALVRALVEHAERKPTVIALHGFDRSDALSRDCVRHLLRAVRHSRGDRRSRRLLLVVTSQEGQLPALREFEAARRVAFHVRARGYSREDLQELATSQLGKPLSVTVREGVYRAAAGDTRHVHRLLQRLQKGAYQATRMFESTTACPAFLEDDYRQLDASRRQVVSLLCASGFQVEESILDAWIERHGVALDDLADPGEILGWLEEQDWVRATVGISGRRWLVEPDVAEAVLAVEDPDRMARVASEVAGLLTERGGGTGRGTVRAFRLLVAARAWRIGCGATPGVDSILDDGVLPFGETALCSVGDVAARYAESLGASAEALEILEEALSKVGEEHDDLAEELEHHVVRLLGETGNFREAVELLESRVRRETDPAREAGLHRRIGELRGRLGDRAGRLRSFQESLGCFERVSNDEERSRTTQALAGHWLEEGDLELAAQTCESAIEAFDVRGSFDERERRSLWQLLASIRLRQGDTEAAAELEERIYQGCVRADDVAGQIGSLVQLGNLFAQRGDPGQVEACLKRALELAEADGSRRVEADICCQLGRIFGDRREYDEAFQFLERAWSILYQFDDETGLAHIEAGLVDCELRTGRLRRSARTLLHCIERRFGCSCVWPLRADSSADGASTAAIAALTRERRERQSRLEARAAGSRESLSSDEIFELVDLWTGAGEIEEAFRLLEFALGREELRRNVDTRTRAVQELGRLADLRGDVELALKSFEQSLKPRGGTPSREHIGVAYLEVGRLLLLRGHLDRSLDCTLRGLRVAWDEGSVEAIVDALLRLTEFYAEGGEFRGASVVCTGAVNLARIHGLWERELRACTLAARVARGAGKERATRRALARAWELDRALERPVERCLLLLESGWERYERRDYSRAEEQAQEGLDLARRTGALALEPEFWHLIGAVQGSTRNSRNNLLSALEVLERVERDAVRRGRPRLAWEACSVLEEVYASRGKAATAAAVHQRADEVLTLCLSALPSPLRSLRWSNRHHGGFSQNPR